MVFSLHDFVMKTLKGMSEQYSEFLLQQGKRFLLCSTADRISTQTTGCYFYVRNDVKLPERRRA